MSTVSTCVGFGAVILFDCDESKLSKYKLFCLADIDNAQLKVHRLVLSACTEYFELLERTCEMYEDCLVMPDDLQADVIVPIVNFMYTEASFTPQKSVVEDPRPTRYEIPEELESENMFDNSFSNISYTSQPLVVHPDTVKRYKAAKRNTLFGEPSSSKKVSENERDSNQLFDQMLDNNGGPKVTIETKDSKAASNLDHARIISEVLKKYPHLVKSNKNIKLKILDPVPGKGKKQAKSAAAPSFTEPKSSVKTDEEDFTYETDVIDSKQAAKLIAMGAENVKGPWICLICGTPGKALHFNSYYKFRRHLVDVHHEKPVANICEYCGLRSLKRNYLLHHLYAQHGVQPPPQYHFPKCNMCSYIALTEGLLVKHKLTHKDIRNFRCNVCSVAFASSSQLLIHIQNTGHKYSSERKNNLQCIYCLKIFLRESNLYAHLKTHHKKEAKTDCIIDSSDDEKIDDERPRSINIKYEPSTSYENDFEEVDIQYPSHQISTSDKHSTPRRQPVTNARQKILNPGFSTPKSNQKPKPGKISSNFQSQNDFFQDVKIPIESTNEEIVVIDNNEYIMKDNQLIPRKKTLNQDFILEDIVEPDSVQPTTSVEYANMENANIEENVQPQSSMILKKSVNLNQPIQIVVSNDEEYKALMNSNHPILFDNGDTTKTLAVLTTQHNTGIETGKIDLDNTTSSEMMILPSEYPLNVSEAVSTDNPNIVVVYSHDDQSKQFQILTTGDIGAQFVQSSGMITQTFETVTTATPAINQVEQNWQNNIESLESQQMQMTHQQHTEHNATTDNLDHIAEVHMISEPQKEITSGGCEIALNPTDAIIEQMNNPTEDNINNEPSNISTTASETNDTHTDQNNIVEPMQIQNVLEQPLENTMKVPPVSETIIEQPMDTEGMIEQPIGIESMQEQPMETENIEQPVQNENITEQAIETEYVIEQPLEADIVMEQQLTNELEISINTGGQSEPKQVMDTKNEIQEPVMSANIAEQTMESGNMIEQPAEDATVLEHRVPSNILEQAIENENIMEQTQELQNILEQPVERENILKQSSSIENSTTQTTPQVNTDPKNTSEYPEVVKTDESIVNAESLNQQPQELMESQAYDDIVEINNPSEEQTVNPKETGSKIHNLALEWSEDEYDIRENQDHNNTTTKTNAETQKIPFIDDAPELEESIENIQQEMQKQMASQLNQIETPDVETEESTVSSQEEDSSSQEMQLPPLIDSPVHGPIPNPQVQQKLSSLLNDWEDNDSQEDIIPDNSTHENILPKADTNKPRDIPKNDNIRSLVSDWDDDDDKE
ncbi:unnamed protein product [Spodoptera littoralis]|uniref:Centrosome-associated zinc finger protein CP190 n=1 Tax=Spodoptera littoralis TaxID=7109 RepID=A0A9P0I073_SPOLI|nr:unnamed protein product [Spodoptera littoralis]CAH1637409.1 unnamed protein product [Spodoptera littoralis]